VPVIAVVDALEEFPDYAFFEVWESGPEAAHPDRRVTLHFLAAGSAVYSAPITSGSSTFYGVPRAVAERVPGWRAFVDAAALNRPPKHESQTTTEEEWVVIARKVKTGEVPGAISIPFATTEKRLVTDGGGTFLIHQRTTRTPAGVSFVKVEHPATDGSGVRGDCGNSDENGNNGPRESEGAGSERSKWPAPVVWALVGLGATGGLALLLGGVWLALRLSRGTT
jgi:hypothetical protein